MSGPMSFAPNPPIMENVFRRRLGLNVSGSVVNRNSNNNILGGTMRCLFGAPDPRQAKDVVREVELKNALNFGKRYNFDIINGEPFPSAKRRKVSHPDDSDEENQHVNDTHTENVKNDNEGYIWTETCKDQMAMCNTKQAVNTNLVGPNRYSGVSLLCAITVHSNQTISPNSTVSSSSSTDTNNQTEKESPKLSPSSQSDISSSSTAIIPAPLYLVSSNETNNDVINNNKSHSNNYITTENGTEKKLNLINSSSYEDTHQTNQQSSLAKKSTLASAHHIVKKYTNRTLKHAVKKTRQSVITDYLQVRRTVVKTSQPSGKKY